MTCNTSAPDLEFHNIHVNGECISKEALAMELQYHPAASAEAAMQQAGNALVIRCLLRQRAEQEGLSPETAGEEAAVSELLKREAPAPEAGEAECRRYFEANRARFVSPPLLELSHILLAAAPDDEAARLTQKALADELLTTLHAAPNQFGALARRHSACPSKTVDGSMGQISKGNTVDEFERAVFALDAGLAPHPIETRYGFHLVLIHPQLRCQ